MRASYYDVILLGAELPTLMCGALLSKRGFRVLLLGQQTPNPDYAVGALRLPRRPFSYTAQRSPVARRLMAELGLAQSLRRMTSRTDPAFQLTLPRHRLDVGSSGTPFEREVEREFPEVKRPILEFHRLALEHAQASDRLFEADLSWPPETFLERRELQSLSRQLPFDRDGRNHDLLAEFPEDHPFRRAIKGLVTFGSDGEASAVNPLQLSRSYAARYEAASLPGGLAILHQLLIERIRSHSGEVRLDERAQEITVRRSMATGVRLFGTEETIGGSFVVAGIDVSSLLRLLPHRDPLEELFERVGEPRVRSYRYALNLVLERGGLPEGMGRDVFYVRQGARRSAADQLLRIQLGPLDDKLALAAIEAHLPARAVERQGAQLEGVREKVLAAAAELMPFLDENLALLDSPHDGRPPEARRPELEVTLRPGDRRGPRTMPVMYAYPVTRALGICAMPMRTPLRALLLCNNQIAPWLGLEGQMLAAGAAARAISRADRTKAWMRSRLWAKVEI